MGLSVMKNFFKTSEIRILQSEFSGCTIFFCRFLYKKAKIVMCDFNAVPQNPNLKSFCVRHGFYNHIKSQTCWNQKHSLKNSGTVETGLSDHHSLVYSMFKSTFTKLAQVRIYNYKFLKDLEMYNLQDNLSLNLANLEPFFMKLFMIFLHLH